MRRWALFFFSAALCVAWVPFILGVLFVVLTFIVSTSITQLVVPHVLLVSLQGGLFSVPDRHGIRGHTVPHLNNISFFPAVLLSSYNIFTLHVLVNCSIPTLHTICLLPRYLFLIYKVALLCLANVTSSLIKIHCHRGFIVRVVYTSFFPLTNL